MRLISSFFKEKCKKHLKLNRYIINFITIFFVAYICFLISNMYYIGLEEFYNMESLENLQKYKLIDRKVMTFTIFLLIGSFISFISFIINISFELQRIIFETERKEGKISLDTISLTVINIILITIIFYIKII